MDGDISPALDLTHPLNHGDDGAIGDLSEHTR